MEHSEAYTDLFRYLNATGMERAYGAYSPGTLDEICDWERDEVEEAIWREFKFHGNLPDLVSKLQNYDGIEALNAKLREGIINSEYSARMVDIASALYEATSIEDYLDYIFEYYDKKKEYGTIAVLSYLKPCNKLYVFFKNVYLDSGDSVARSTAVDGMIYCKGYIKDPGEIVTGIIDATESDVYIVYCESDNTYNPSLLSKDLNGKPSIGDTVRLLKKQKGQSVIMSI